MGGLTQLGGGILTSCLLLSFLLPRVSEYHPAIFHLFLLVLFSDGSQENFRCFSRGDGHLETKTASLKREALY